ncbi:TPA: MazG-like family protein [Mannheimia haemolytica]
MQQLIKNIEQWAEDRNLIHGSTPQKQMLKLMKEFGELCGSIARDNPEMIKDAIGDCFVVLTILNKQIQNEANLLIGYETEGRSFDVLFRWITKNISDLIEDLNGYNIQSVVCDLKSIASHFNLNFQNCIQHAYDQIKDRKGKMIDGVFVKESDL